MEKNIIIIIIAVIAIGYRLYSGFTSPVKKSFKSEQEYEAFCNKYGYLYIPDTFIRYVVCRENYPLEKKKFLSSKERELT